MVFVFALVRVVCFHHNFYRLVLVLVRLGLLSSPASAAASTSISSWPETRLETRPSERGRRRKTTTRRRRKGRQAARLQHIAVWVYAEGAPSPAQPQQRRGLTAQINGGLVHPGLAVH